MKTVLSLDGQWQVAESIDADKPGSFERSCPVPGLIDMAKPSFEKVGVDGGERRYFWYKRNFTIQTGEFAQLKIHKAQYGTAVWLNGHFLGEQLPCFTPSYWDLKPHLQADGENELMVRIGHHNSILPVGMPNGSDFEKQYYIPGIYDTVELISCASPRIVNVQCVPRIHEQQLLVIVELENGSAACQPVISAEVLEDKSGKLVLSREIPGEQTLESHATSKVEFTLPIPDCKLWWPESPFLYRLKLRTAGDSYDTRFGMREFHFDLTTKLPVINGQKRYLKGSNVCIYRFFEDEARGNKPWDREWVRQLHRRFKTMNWDTLRYCIGFPPDFWYEIADEEGVLIFDEFPIWTLETLKEHPERLQAEQIIPEYRAWMRERWNHPCVIVWDAQNESHTDEAAIALQAVRHLDRSNRPWEGGWGIPQSKTDCAESHPYLFIKNSYQASGPFFSLAEMASVDRNPWLTEKQRLVEVPIIINEYDWLWINRKGEATGLTQNFYRVVLGKDATAEQRRAFHARGVAALTEFWRSHRRAAAVMHFCGLGYSRTIEAGHEQQAATSDDLIDLDQLIFEPQFERYVKDAFNPLGIMLDFWSEKILGGSRQTARVAVINDYQTPWTGEVTLVIRGDHEETLGRTSLTVEPLGRAEVELSFVTPWTRGAYTLSARLQDGDRCIQSLRDVRID